MGCRHPIWVLSRTLVHLVNRFTIMIVIPIWTTVPFRQTNHNHGRCSKMHFRSNWLSVNLKGCHHTTSTILWSHTPYDQLNHKNMVLISTWTFVPFGYSHHNHSPYSNYKSSLHLVSRFTILVLIYRYAVASCAFTWSSWTVVIPSVWVLSRTFVHLVNRFTSLIVIPIWTSVPFRQTNHNHGPCSKMHFRSISLSVNLKGSNHTTPTLFWSHTIWPFESHEDSPHFNMNLRFICL